MSHFVFGKKKKLFVATPTKYFRIILDVLDFITLKNNISRNVLQKEKFTIHLINKNYRSIQQIKNYFDE